MVHCFLPLGNAYVNTVWFYIMIINFQLIRDFCIHVAFFYEHCNCHFRSDYFESKKQEAQSFKKFRKAKQRNQRQSVSPVKVGGSWSWCRDAKMQKGVSDFPVSHMFCKHFYMSSPPLYLHLCVLNWPPSHTEFLASVITLSSRSWSVHVLCVYQKVDLFRF